jgi:hypothetical protein
MNQENRDAKRQRVLEMVEIEERLGPVVSGGPFRYATTEANQPRLARHAAMPLASFRARGRIRFVAYAVAAPRKAA